jgi:hypothetical protein
LHSEIHELINSIWNKEQLPQEWKESIIVPIYKNGGKTNCSNYIGISLLPATFKILSTILFSRLNPYVDETIGGLWCRFRQNRSPTV